MRLVFYGDSLCHNGIKGQKWGKRRYQNPDGSLTPLGREHYGVGEAKSDYKLAKKEYKKNVKKTRKEIRKLEGITGLNVNKMSRNRDEINKKRDSMKKGYIDLVDKKVAYKVASKKSDKAKEKAEAKVYKQAMGGMRDSQNDITSGGRITDLYNHIKTKKGKDYADKIEQNIGHKAVGLLAASAAVSIGATVASVILENRNS
jgi:hypothetical protein